MKRFTSSASVIVFVCMINGILITRYRLLRVLFSIVPFFSASTCEPTLWNTGICLDVFPPIAIQRVRQKTPGMLGLFAVRVTKQKGS